MEYDDFLILNDYSQMAKAYYNSMKKRGFVFFRLDDVEEQKMLVCQNVLTCFQNLLEGYKKSTRMARGNEQRIIKKLGELTQKQLELFKSEFSLKSQQTSKNMQTQPIFNEAKLLKNLFELYKLEDNERKNVVISLIIENRLDTLSEN